MNCAPTCSASFADGTQVTLTATPAAGSTFTGWGGDCSGTSTCTVTMSQARTVVATFTTRTLTVTKTGTGTGTVTSNPAGINCGQTCSANFTDGTQVTLTATPAAGSTFTGWSNECAFATTTCTVTMTQARSVTAQFTVPPTSFTLGVSMLGTGSGTVTSTPAGINCGQTCTASYATGTQVTLTATPAAGSAFSGWKGACSGTGACTVTMDQTRAAYAEFTPIPRTLTISKNGTGTITSTPAGINCGTTCTATYDHGTQVTLTPDPATGSTFAGWGGDCTGTGACVVTMTQARSVAATFNLPPPDTTPPITTITLDPPRPRPGNYYFPPVDVEVSATDDNPGTIETRCVLDPQDPPTRFEDFPDSPCPYLEGGRVSADGRH
ncbi:MAG: InlB B-repeat-containing protein, partial [Actinobacteria bacterium]|nr:InlB B-repeat-containing protein [Actinomycetota bacterium]